MTFYRWMIRNYLRTDDRIGDLARDAKADPTFPKKCKTKRKIYKYLESVDACSACIETFEIAWGLYSNENC